MDYSSSSTVSDESLSYKMKKTGLEKNILVERNGLDVVDPPQLKKSQRLKTTWVVGEPSPPRPRFLRYNPHRSKEILTRIQKAIEVRGTVISAEEQENKSTAEITEEEEEEEGEDDIEEDEDEEKKSGCCFKGLFKLLCVMYVLMQWSSYMSNTNSSSSPVLLPIGAEEGERYYWRNQSMTFEFEKEWKQPFGDELLLPLLGKTSEEQLMSELGDERIESLLDDDEKEEEIMLLPEEEIPFLNYSSSSEVDDDLMKEEISNSALESGDSCGNSMRDPPLPPADNALIPAVDYEDPKDEEVEESSSTNLDQLMLTSGGNLKEEVAEKPEGEAVTSSTIHSIHMMLKALVSFTVLSFVSLVAVCYLRRNLHNKNKPTTSVRRSSRHHNPPSAATATATATATCVKNEEKEGAEEGHDVVRAPTVELLSELEFQPQNEKVMPLLPLQPPASFQFSITDSRSCRSTKKKKKTAAYDEDADNEATTSKAFPLTTPIRRSTRLQNRTTIQSPYAAASATTAKSFR